MRAVGLRFAVRGPADFLCLGWSLLYLQRWYGDRSPRADRVIDRFDNANILQPFEP